MTVSVCPIATVNASVEHVWEFLSKPANYDLWWDARTQSIIPEGNAQAGQVIHATTHEFGRAWDVTAIVDALDESQHRIDLTTKLPFGITGYNHITCTALADGTTQVTFG